MSVKHTGSKKGKKRSIDYEPGWGRGEGMGERAVRCCVEEGKKKEEEEEEEEV